MNVIRRLKTFLTITVIVFSFLIWYFFEEDSADTAQAIYFFIGAYS